MHTIAGFALSAACGIVTYLCLLTAWKLIEMRSARRSRRW